MASPPGTMLEFSGVSCRFGQNTVVNNVSFQLEQGQVLSLLGPSGCGKTTILRMASGLERASSGAITYRGAIVDSAERNIFLPPNRRDMGMVFQSYGIWPHMDVFENIAFPLRMRKEQSQVIETKVADMLRQVGLSGFEKRPGTKLSGGQQQRVAVARGLVSNPGVLLMDEPFSNLDLKIRSQLRAELKSLQLRLGLSILFVTHDQAEALSLSDRIAVMQNGVIEQIGTPSDVYNKPATPFVRDFVGDSVKLEGKIERLDGAKRILRLGDGTFLHGNHGNIPADAQTCTASIRPEEIEILRRGEERATNVIHATLETLLFQGREYEAVLKAGNGQSFMIRLPRDVAQEASDGLRLHFPPEKLNFWAEQ